MVHIKFSFIFLLQTNGYSYLLLFLLFFLANTIIIDWLPLLLQLKNYQLTGIVMTVKAENISSFRQQLRTLINESWVSLEECKSFDFVTTLFLTKRFFQVHSFGCSGCNLITSGDILAPVGAGRNHLFQESPIL